MLTCKIAARRLSEREHSSAQHVHNHNNNNNNSIPSHPERSNRHRLGVVYSFAMRQVGMGIAEHALDQLFLKPALSDYGLGSCSGLAASAAFGGFAAGEVSPCTEELLGHTAASVGDESSDGWTSGQCEVAPADPTSMTFCGAWVDHPLPSGHSAVSLLDNSAELAYNKVSAAAVQANRGLSATCQMAMKRAICLDKFPVCDCNYQTACKIVCDDMNRCTHEAFLANQGAPDECEMDCHQLCGCDSRGTLTSPEQLCDNTCRGGAYSGICADGGPGAQTSACAYGTDCGDCGPRDPNGGGSASVGGGEGGSVDTTEREEDEEEGCFIATAAYGTELHPNLYLLRQYRDLVLPKPLVQWYYHVSPPIARWVATRPLARILIRSALSPIVTVIWLARLADATYTLAQCLTILALILPFTIIPLRAVRKNAQAQEEDGSASDVQQ